MGFYKSCIAIAVGSCISTALVHAISTPAMQVSSHCSQYDRLSEHYKTCAAYDKSKVKELTGKINLNTSIDEAAEGQLLIIPASDKSTPYLLSEPIKLKKNMGLLSTGKGSKGFFHVAPAAHFTIGDNPVYYLLQLAEGNRITGLGVDAQLFNATAVKTLNTLSVDKVLVYSLNVNQFTLNWISLFGRTGLKATFWANGKNGQNGAMNKVQRSWLESAGADNTAIFKGSDEAKNPQEVNLKHLIVRVSGVSGSDRQRGLWLAGVKGEVEHNYLFFDNSSGNQKRTLLTLDSLTDPRPGHTPTVTENYFYSPNDTLQKKDSALQFLQSSEKELNVSVFSNAYTNNMSIASDNNPNAGKYVLRMENYRVEPLPYTPAWKQFFDETSDETIWPRGGVCFAPLYVTKNLNKTIHNVGSDAWKQLCGLGVKDHEFGLAYEYTGRPSESLSREDLLKWEIATGIGWTAFIISFAFNIKYFLAWRAGNKTE